MHQRPFPVVTLGLALAAIVTYLVPGWSELLAYDRSLIVDGQWWRALTGHLTHWTGDHLLWDVAMFVVLGVLIERAVKPSVLLATLVVSALAISAGLWGWQLEFEQYRGLSGLDSALFAFAGLLLFNDARQRRQFPVQLAIVGLALGFVAKLGWELATGSTVFVDSAGGGFVPLPLVHVIGAAAGALVFATARIGARPAHKPQVVSTSRLPDVSQPDKRAAIASQV